MSFPKSDSEDDFQPTPWSLILRSREGSEPSAAEALNTLCSLDWYPLYVSFWNPGLTNFRPSGRRKQLAAFR